MPPRRLVLLAFGLALVLLFGIVAATEGIGRPSLPPGVVAIVEGVPGDAGTITAVQLRRGTDQYAAFDGKKDPHEGNYVYYRRRALERLLEEAWVRGRAAELGVSVTAREVTARLKLFRRRQFGSEAEYRESLAKARLTPADLRGKAEVQLLTEAIAKRTSSKPPKPTDSEIEEYYEVAAPIRFTTKASRDVRVIVATSMGDALAAKRALDRDSSPAGWLETAKRYSIDQAGNESGGLVTGLEEGAAEEPLNAALFNAPRDRVEGPVDGNESRVYVFEVVKVSPERVRSLSEVRSKVVSEIKSHALEEDFTRYIVDYKGLWTSRTVCASYVAIAECSNFPAFASAPGAHSPCEAPNPRAGLPEACPAPVLQRAVALPGSVTLVEPHGKPLAQGPQPAGIAEG